jgi:hypothetical protein
MGSDLGEEGERRFVRPLRVVKRHYHRSPRCPRDQPVARRGESGRSIVHACPRRRVKPRVIRVAQQRQRHHVT